MEHKPQLPFLDAALQAFLEVVLKVTEILCKPLYSGHCTYPGYQPSHAHM